MSERYVTVLLALIVAVIAFAAFAPSLHNEFVWDDPIVFERQLPYFDSARSVFVPPPGIPQFGEHYYRPLIVGTYLLDEGIAKVFWPEGRREEARRFVYHASPVVYHAIATALVFLAGIVLLGTAGPPDRAGRLASAGAAILFAVHPIHVESVAWMAGRSDTLCAIFFLGALIAYVRYVQTGRGAFASMAAVSYLAALLAKETALGLLPMFLAVELCVPHGTAPAMSERAPAASTRAERRRKGRGKVTARAEAPASHPMPEWLAWGALALATAIYFVLRSKAISSMGSPALDRSPRLDRIAGAIGWYVVKAFWPPPQSAFVDGVPGGLFAVIGVAIPIASLAAFLWCRRRPAWRPEALALALFFCGLALSVVIALFPISKTPLAERYLYLPSAGLCLLVAFLLRRAAARLATMSATVRLALPLGACALLALPALAGTLSRQHTWSNNLSFWQAAVSGAPDAGVPHLHLGITYADLGRREDALAEYRLALKYYKDATGRAKAHNDMGSLLIQMERYDDAIEQFRQAMVEDPRYETPHYNVAVALMARRGAHPSDPVPPGTDAEIVRELEQAIALNPRYTKAHLQYGSVLVQLGRVREGVEHLRFTVQIAPASPEARQASALLKRLGQ